MSSRFGRIAPFAVLTLVLGLPGCGGGGSSSPTTPSTPAPTPRPPTVLNTSFSGLGRLEAQSATLTIGEVDADIDIVADWTFASNDVDVFVTSSSCSTSSFVTLFNQTSGCTSLIRGTSVTKPERTTGRLSQGTYKLWAGSAASSRSDESGVIQVTVRPR
jgi:hypothetical protein